MYKKIVSMVTIGATVVSVFAGDMAVNPGPAQAAVRTVNALDWSVMNAQWFTNNATADINEDGIVNSLDFGLMNRE
jgi:hypothetical protein